MLGSDPLEQARFFDTLAHELRGPLFPIIALSDLLLTSSPEDIGGDEWRDHLSLIGRSAGELNRMLGDLLELSRLQAERVPPDPAAVDVAAVAAELERTGAAVGVEGPQAIFTDRIGLRRCADALIAHANADTDANAELQIAVKPGRITVATWVPTMTEDERAALFTPFWRREGPGNNAVRAHGLALVLVKLTCVQLGGQIRAVRNGDRIRLEGTLPCAIPPATQVTDRYRVLFVAERLPVIYQTALVVQAAGHDMRLVLHPAEIEEVSADWPPHHVVRNASDADKVRGALGV